MLPISLMPIGHLLGMIPLGERMLLSCCERSICERVHHDSGPFFVNLLERPQRNAYSCRRIAALALLSCGNITLWLPGLNLQTCTASSEDASSAFLWWNAEMQFDVMLVAHFVLCCCHCTPAIIGY